MARSRSKFAGWGDALLDAGIVAGSGAALVYLGGDQMIADFLSRNVLPMTGLSYSSGLLRPIVFGVTVGSLVFIIDLVMMYKNDYHK